jgi:hypothetical protein
VLRFNMSGEMNRRLPLEKVSNFSTVQPEPARRFPSSYLLKSKDLYAQMRFESQKN